MAAAGATLACRVPWVSRAAEESSRRAHGPLDVAAARGGPPRRRLRHVAARSVMGRQHYLAMAMAMERGAQKQVLSEDHVVTTFRLRSDFVRVDVVNAQDGSQKIVVDTDRPGRLILHWGVVGGPEYKGGWRLPGEAVWPKGTYNYKKRALQTPFVAGPPGERQSVTIELSRQENSEILNFVLKDLESEEWFDNNGQNFAVVIAPVGVGPGTLLESRADDGGGARGVDVAADVGGLPALPQELCGIWAYIKWEQAGCPNRSQEDADKEYQAGIKEMNALLRTGRSLDFLWRVARGEVKYRDVADEIAFAMSAEVTGTLAALSTVDAERLGRLQRMLSERQAPEIPQDTVNRNAFLIWWRSGRPMGADFGDQSRRELVAEIRAGRDVRGLVEQVDADYVRAWEEHQAAQRRAEEERRKAEEARRVEEEARRREEQERRRAEEARRAEEEGRRVQEEGRRKAEEARRVEEGRRVEEEGRRKAEDEKRKAEEGTRKAEDGKEKEKEKRRGRRKAEAAPTAQAADATVEDVPEAPALPEVPRDVVNRNAFLLWFEGGRPQGADFSGPSLDQLRGRLAAGESLDAVTKEVTERHRRAKEQQAEERKAQEERERVEREKGAAAEREAQKALVDSQREAPVQSVEDVGGGMATGKRDPFSLINESVPEDKVGIPRLSLEAPKAPEPLRPLSEAMGADEEVVWKRVYPLGEKSGLLVGVYKPDVEGDGPVRVQIWTDNANDLVLHWGVSRSGRRRERWALPPKGRWPEGTAAADGKSADTPFLSCDDSECMVEVGGAVVPLQRVTLEFTREDALVALTFVLRSADGTRWWKDGSGDFSVPLPFKAAEAEMGAASPDLAQDKVAMEIVDAEGSDQWTLMHRYNRASDLIEGVLQGRYGRGQDQVASAMSRVFIWLRYSSTRQLTWQRRYNTQPRILSSAQERMTRTIMAAVRDLRGEAQYWARLCLSMVGRGGDGQRIRDEILNIMHRHHIKEVKGTWMEEWHQKLHNNTTPDDIPICEAYIAFLKGNGDIGAYWRVLSDAGLTRQRLESFDRPIVAEPHSYADKKDALISDLYGYLGILKACHSGADLSTSIANAGGRVSVHAKGLLGYVQSHLQSPQVLSLVEAAVEARAEIRGDTSTDRELLYLDLALQDVVRAAAERGAGARNAVALVGPLLENLCLSYHDNEELCFCLKAWQELPESISRGRGRPSENDALQAMAVVDRVRRALAHVSDETQARIGAASASMGRAFGCENWAVELFAEEVIRGGPAFAVSLVLGSVEPQLRQQAKLGSWQVISPASVQGRVVQAKGLHEVQDKAFPEPTVLVCERVTGEEEIPDGVVAVLTPDAPDVLSHVAVRARNLKTLFATCYENSPMEELEGLSGKVLSIKTTAAGDVTWAEAAAGAEGSEGAGHGEGERPRHLNLKVTIPEWCGKWAVPMGDFKDGVVGAKSKNIARLRGQLPDWVRLPSSVTVPFGSFEEVLSLPENADVRRQIEDAAQMVGQDPAAWLKQCRDLAMRVKVPASLRQELTSLLESSDMGALADTDARWAEAEEALKRVWASKFNERACVSCKKVGLNFMDVRMAVLVQQVVDAQYAFVLHTTNPSTGDAGEVYAEMVVGLGETLVSGMYPGRSLAFAARKDALDQPRVLSYPSKSVGLFVSRSLIFRSDSNGEDLEGYAGAGLYDSVTTRHQEERRVDYSAERLSRDAEFRREVLSRVLQVGVAIEKALGSAQDVEGVVDQGGNITVVQTRPQM